MKISKCPHCGRYYATPYLCLMCPCRGLPVVKPPLPESKPPSKTNIENPTRDPIKSVRVDPCILPQLFAAIDTCVETALANGESEEEVAEWVRGVNKGVLEAAFDSWEYGIEEIE